jgi:hypothetical protein
VVSGNGQSASFTPMTLSDLTASVTVTDSNYLGATASCSVNSGPGGNALTITTSSTLPYGTVGSFYSKTLAATGGTGSYTWSGLSALPNGLTLSSSGLLSGNPTTAGSYTFYIQVADTGGHSASSEFALTIASGGAQSSIQISLAYPQLSGTYPGGTHQFTFHFTDPLGPSDISGGQIAFNIDTTGPDLPVCQLDWNTAGNLNITGIAYGNFGGGQISSTYCNVYTGESSLMQTAQGYDVTVVLSFPQPLPNTILPAWTRGIPKTSGISSFTPVGAHIAPRVEENPDPEDGDDGDDPPDDPITFAPSSGQSEPPPCAGQPIFGSQLSRYSDGTLAAALTASADTEGNPGWENWTQNGHLLSPSGELANTGMANASSTDDNVAVLPFNSGAGNPGGTYQVVGDFYFEHPHPSCSVIFNLGFPGYIEENGSGRAAILGYTRTFNVPRPALRCRRAGRRLLSW